MLANPNFWEPEENHWLTCSSTDKNSGCSLNITYISFRIYESSFLNMSGLHSFKTCLDGVKTVTASQGHWWVGLVVFHVCVFMLCVKMCNDVPSRCESVGCCRYRWLTCIHALSTGQHKWKEGYTGSSCRSQMNTQKRVPACWPGKPHLVVDCPVVNNVRWGEHPSCSL